MSQQSDDIEAFAAKFRLAEMHLAESGGWTLSLRPAQVTLGAMVLSARSGTRDLAGLTPQEAVGMAEGFGLAERLSRGCFGAVRINILCLMMQDPIVHFHILPRYDRTVSAAGRDWIDADWPGPPGIAGDPTEDSVLAELRGTLRAAL